MRMRTRRRAACLVVALAALGVGLRPCAADEPARGRGPHVPEFVEMAWSILTRGADMGPGQGWFHPSRDRYGWAWLASRCDKDGDGAVTPAEFGGEALLFARLDRDRDGAIRADDFDWSAGSAYLRGRSMARGRFAQMDANSNGKVSKAEWDALFDRIGRGKGSITPDDLADAFYAPPPRPPQGAPSGPGQGGPSRLTLFKGLLSGEVGSAGEGPDVGEVAPDFTLRTADGGRFVSLADSRGRKPVVLIFGSFT